MMTVRRLRPSRAGSAALIAAVLTLAQGVCSAQDRPVAGTTTFVFDGNRMYAELGFVRPDQSIHRALAFVDMGSQFMTVRAALFDELQLDRGGPLSFTVGALSVDVPGAAVVREQRAPSSLGRDLKVEATLPASVLERYQVAIDYRARTLVLAMSGTLKPEGVRVPFRINTSTGLIVVDVTIDHRAYAITIDNGSAYTWVRKRTATEWTRSHPGWERGTGAVGTSNMTMAGDGSEAAGTLLRIPEVSVGALTLKQVGVFAAAPGRKISGDLDLFDWYSQKNAETVVGWIGGNILKSFRLTIDYPNRMSYWLARGPIDEQDLDQIGLTLRSSDGAYYVAGVATKNGEPTVTGVLPGDKLLRVGGVELATATWGQIYESMHGTPGESRSLTLERNGVSFAITATVTAF